MVLLRAVLVFLLACISVKSEEIPISLSGDTKSLNLVSRLHYYLSKDPNLSIDEISSENFKQKFIPSTNASLQFGYIPDTAWIRFSLMELHEKKRDWLIEVDYPGLDTVEFYYKVDEVWHKKISGDAHPFSKREFFYRNPLFSLDLAHGKIETFYIKIQTTGTLIIPVNLYQTNNILPDKFIIEGWYFIFYGIMIVMILYASHLEVLAIYYIL